MSAREAPRALVSGDAVAVSEKLGKDVTPRAAASHAQTPARKPSWFFSSFDTLELTPGSSSAGLELKHERSLRHLRAFAPVDSLTKTKQGRIRGAMLGERSHDPWRLQWDLRRHHHAAPAVPS